MPKKKIPKSDTDINDPHPYDGPIERADGTRPYNQYLWPTESWWANRDMGYRFSSRFHFGIVALADGRFSTSGFVWNIEKNECAGRPCVFADRTSAIRSAAAQLIRLARALSRDKDRGTYQEKLQGSDLARLINWVLDTVTRETGGNRSSVVTVKEPPPKKVSTGYPLLDLAL